MFTRRDAHFSIHKPGKAGVSNQLEEGEMSELEKTGSFMMEHTIKCHGGVSSTYKMDDYEFVVFN